ncbi:hypothetical protein ACWENR_23905 [Micromonospora sp. NPDC004336]
MYDRWWKLAREKAFTESQVASPLVRRPYDLRHAAASLWLNAGVPPTEVARRLGHGVAVLLRVYANCIDGGDDSMNDKIAKPSDDSRHPFPRSTGHNVRVMTGMLGLVLLVVLGSVAVFVLAYLVVSLWRLVRRGVTSLPRALKSLTVEPLPGGAFNDSRDVWPMPQDD